MIYPCMRYALGYQEGQVKFPRLYINLSVMPERYKITLTATWLIQWWCILHFIFVSLDQNQIGAVGSHTVDNMDKQPRHRRVSRADIPRPHHLDHQWDQSSEYVLRIPLLFVEILPIINDHPAWWVWSVIKGTGPLSETLSGSTRGAQQWKIKKLVTSLSLKWGREIESRSF